VDPSPELTSTIRGVFPDYPSRGVEASTVSRGAVALDRKHSAMSSARGLEGMGPATLLKIWSISDWYDGIAIAALLTRASSLCDR